MYEIVKRISKLGKFKHKKPLKQLDHLTSVRRQILKTKGKRNT